MFDNQKCRGLARNRSKPHRVLELESIIRERFEPDRVRNRADLFWHSVFDQARALRLFQADQVLDKVSEILQAQTRGQSFRH